MADTPKVYVICDQNCKFEGMTKEQILTAIMQAVEGGEIKDVDAGFITTIKTINGTALKFFYGEQAAFDELTEEEKSGLYAIITNDTTIQGINEAFENLAAALEDLKDGLFGGQYQVHSAKYSESAETANSANEAFEAVTLKAPTELEVEEMDVTSSGKIITIAPYETIIVYVKKSTTSGTENLGTATLFYTGEKSYSTSIIGYPDDFYRLRVEPIEGEPIAKIYFESIGTLNDLNAKIRIRHIEREV